ncbi:alkaline phosphatase D family protein [Aeoliella mucimassa]|nr:alkaline phosphatase D family protein [Aeoliella mucimassa]
MTLLACLALLTLPAIGDEPVRTTAPEIAISLSMAHRGSAAIDQQLLESYGAPSDEVQQFYQAATEAFRADPTSNFANNISVAQSAEHFGRRLTGGPMLGDVRTDGAQVWLRTTKPASVRVRVVDPSGEEKDRWFGPCASSEESGLAVRVVLDGLTADTSYAYDIEIDGENVTLETPAHFTTLRETSGITRIAFGSCFHKAGLHNPHLLGQVAARENRAMILLGDLAVDDRNNQIGLHCSDYLLRDLSPGWQPFAACMPLYASWDDHDYFDNDRSGIPSGYSAADVAAVRRVWTENWNNPSYGEADSGIYFHTRIGPVDLIMLDTRSLRKAKPKLENAYLGDQQTAWLKSELKQCQGPFTIISSGTMWSNQVSNGKDSWGVWDPNGREALFQLIEQLQVPGVLLLSGDRHGARGMQIARPSGYTFYEFEPASLGGMTGPAAWGNDRTQQWFGHTNIKAFGEFTFDTRPADPTVTFRLVDEQGEVREELTLTQSQLTAGPKDQAP